MRSVNENHAWVCHAVVQRLVQDMLKDFYAQFWWKAFAKGITYRCEVGNLIQQAVPQKPTVRYVYLYITVGLAQRGDPKQMLD